MLKDEESDTRLTKDIKKRIREDLDSRYDGVPERITEILKAAMFLDPRFKTNYIKGIDLECTKQMLVDEASDIEELRIPTATSVPSTSDPPPAKKKRNLGLCSRQTRIKIRNKGHYSLLSSALLPN